MPTQTNPTNPIDPSNESIKLGLAVAREKLERAAANKKVREAYANSLEMEDRLNAVLGINVDLCTRRLESLRSNKPRGVAVIVPATDWHVEESVDPARVSGRNEYNLRIAENRIVRFYGKVLELIKWQNCLAPVVEIWHPLLGDLLTGAIHDDLVETNSLSPTEACVFLQEMICSGIDLWLRKTKLPIFLPTCVGNHGRTTQRKRIKTSVRNSYEWLLYKVLAKRYENHKRVVFMVGEGYHNTQEIMGRKVRFHHGDGLRYNGGVGGITIPVNKSIAQWDKVEAVDLDVFGHWHTFIWGYNKWVSCGSLMGYNEFSVEIKAEFQHPSQAFIVLDRNYGVTSAVPVFVTTSRRKSQ